MPYGHSSASVALRALSVSDEAPVEGLLDLMSGYTMIVHGTRRLPDAARDFLTARPAMAPASAKRPFAIVADGEPVGLIDLVADHPRPGFCFIGLLALVEGRRGEGLGRAAYDLVEQFCRQDLDAVAIRLAVVSANPVQRFWRAMGFSETGEIRPFKGAAIVGEARLMEKPIALSNQPPQTQ